MPNEENLKPFAELTESEQRAIRQKGGKASGEARRRKKSMREQMEMLLSLPVKDPNTREFIKSLGVNSKDINNSMAITLSMYQEALKGNTKAFELIRDTIGEKPVERIQTIEAPVIELGEITIDQDK